MAESVDTHESLDKLVEEYVKADHSKKIDDQVGFYQKMAEKDTRKALLRAIVVPGFGHFLLRRRLEGIGFFLLELVLTGTILVLFVKSVIAIFTSDPHYWRAILWCLVGSALYRVASLVRVAFLANRIKSDAVYLLLRLADKNASADKKTDAST